MQKIILAVMMLVVAKNQLTAQSKFHQQYGSVKDYKRLWYLNIQYIQSWVHSDTATYDKLLWAEDFVHQSGGNGYLYPKKEIMPIFGEKRFNDIEYFYADNTRIQFITDSVAIVFSRPPYLGKGSGVESLSQYNDVYVKRNGSWICVSANITAIKDGNVLLPVLNRIPPVTNFVRLLKGNDEEITALTKLSRRTREIFEQADVKKAEALLDNQFMMITQDGSLYTKKELLARLKKKTQKAAAPYTLENLSVRYVAEDVAMVHGVVIFKLPDGGMSGIQFNDIYVKRSNNWKCVSSNNTPVKN
jgi:Domain of unknown function (DUF4440)